MGDRLLVPDSQLVGVRQLTLKSVRVRSGDLLHITIAAGALVEAVAGVAAPPDQSPALLPTV